MTSTDQGTRGRSTGRATGRPRDAGDDRGFGRGPVELAVRRDLAQLAKRDPALADSGLAHSAISLAAGMDDLRNSLTSRSMAARALREALDRLIDLAPPPSNADKIDALEASAAAKLNIGKTKA